MQSIRQWLAHLGLEQYATSFERNDVDLAVLPELTEAEFDKLGVSLGHRKRMLLALHGAARQLPEPHPASQVESVTVEGERRQVTVLFCDLVGSTALSNLLDPEVYRAILARYQEACIGCIQTVDGFVAQIQGDGVLAYFGYPLAHEGEAERAIRAALGIVQAIAMLDVGLDRPLSVRIGVASGLVVVSHVLAHEKSAVGETPNLAHRLQAIADPGQVMASDRTRTLAVGSFDYEDCGLRNLKGIAEPTRVWRVVGPSGATSRFEAATRGGVSPLVGREQEIALLTDRWKASRAGAGQVALIQGEPGIGKSRLLRAFHEHVRDRVEVALQYQCSPFHVNSAFYPIADHLERALRFEPTDTVDQRLDKLERRLLGDLGRSRIECHLLALALSLSCEPRYGALEMSPQRQKDETVDLLVDIVAQIAGHRPSLVLFEDAHWADPTTIEVLSALITVSEKLPLLVLITYRPEFDPPWRSHPHVTPISLTRLSRTQSASVVHNVAREKAVPPDLVTQIVDRTDGVPLFLEELTKAMLESEALVEAGGRYQYSDAANQLTVPATLRDSLMARLDRLIPVKEIAQIGGVLGREFSYELVRTISPMDQTRLDEALEKLTDSELVFRRGVPPDAVYIFKHALVQDAAYDSILKSKRQSLHAQIAEVIASRFPAKAEGEPEILAHHYTEAGMYSVAIPFWQKAGELAQRRVALQEAIKHFERGLECTARLSRSTERDTFELRLRALLGMAWVALHGYTHPQVEAQLQPAWQLDRSLDRGEYELRILWGLWVYRLCDGRIQESLVWAQRLLARAEEVDNESMRSVGHWAACDSYFFLGEMQLCVEHANALLARYDPVRDAPIADIVNHDPKTIALLYRAGAEWILGFPAKAIASAELGIAHCMKRQHPFDRCWARHFAVPFIHGPCGKLKRADVLLHELESYATEQRLLFFADICVPLNRALLLAWEGRYEKAHDAISTQVDLWSAAGLRVGVPQWRAAQAECAVNGGDPEKALALMEQALMDIAQPGHHQFYVLAEILRVKAVALEALGKTREAESVFLEALRTAREQNAKAFELRTAMSLARLLARQGKHHEALQILESVYRWFTEGHDTRDLRDASQLIEQLKTGSVVRMLDQSAPFAVPTSASAMAAESPSGRHPARGSRLRADR